MPLGHVFAGYGIELDLHLTTDGRLVVFHDDTLDRVCGVTGRVDEKSYAELQQLRLLGTEERIPLFSEVLDIVAGKIPMIVEVKEAGAGAEEVSGEVQPLSGELALVHARMKVIERMVTDIGYRNKFAAGVYSGKIEGLMIGLIVSFTILGFILMG